MGPKKHPLQTAEDQALDAAARQRLYQSRYRRSEKGRVAQVKYRKTATGQRVQSQSNARRIFVGERYHGHAVTTEQAAVIKAHIKERVRAFTRQQAGTQTESA